MIAKNAANGATDLLLHVIDRIAFFTIEREANKKNMLTIAYRGDLDITLRINERGYRFEDGVLTIRANDLISGENVCDVFTHEKLISCESLTMRGGYVLPSGITQKAYVLNLHSMCARLAERNAELEKELARMNEEKEVFTDDIFDLG